jgi:hypothetical protein
MSRNYSRAAADSARKKRRRNSLVVSIIAIAIIVTLLVTEQVALLYLTIGVAALMLVVAFSDLHGAQQVAAATPAPADDSAAIGDRSGAPRVTTASYGTNVPRRPKRRTKR